MFDGETEAGKAGSSGRFTWSIAGPADQSLGFQRPPPALPTLAKRDFPLFS